MSDTSDIQSLALPSVTTALIIPTLNAKTYLEKLIPAIKSQTLKLDEVLVLDSASTDGTPDICRNAGFRVEHIEPGTFNHGTTRDFGVQITTADICIFLTQDALPVTNTTFEMLVQPYSDERVGICFGRQKPYPETSILGQHARTFNYPDKSVKKSLENAAELGIKACFNSDSFSSYRRRYLEQIGGMPHQVIVSEDTYVAAKMILAGYSVFYNAKAEVYHSHDYSILNEFRRYFDNGVFYGRELWIKEAFGTANSEGFKFVQSELQTLREAKQLYRLPEVILRTFMKYSGYKLGFAEKYIPVMLKRKLGLHSGYWK